MTKQTCGECARLFDMNDSLDSDEFNYGHDCEEEMGRDYWEYVFEIRRLLMSDPDADLAEEYGMAGEPADGGGFVTVYPAERLYSLQTFFANVEGWDWPVDLIRHVERDSKVVY